MNEQHWLRRFDTRPLSGDVRAECICRWSVVARRPEALAEFRLHQESSSVPAAPPAPVIFEITRVDSRLYTWHFEKGHRARIGFGSREAATAAAERWITGHGGTAVQR